jgi:hypothetical protein
MDGKYTIAYVLSLPHSGSTLCGSLLGAHSRAFCLGEPWKIRQYARLERQKDHKTGMGNECTCGAPTIWDCVFWPKVDAEMKAKSGLGLRDLDTASTDQERFQRDNKLLFDAVAAVTGATLLVDSSKRRPRLKQLIDSAFADVKVVHLLREPHGQVVSTMKRSGRGPYRHTARNVIETLSSSWMVRSLPTISTRYEEMAGNPEAWLRQMMPQFGLEFEENQLNWAQLERHNISGNVSRSTKSSAISTDVTWRERLSPLEKAYIGLVTSPLRLGSGS